MNTLIDIFEGIVVRGLAGMKHNFHKFTLTTTRRNVRIIILPLWL